ncbi:MAG: RnfH family protein [Pseudomonadota bacterium]
MSGLIDVEVVYALRDQQKVVTVQVEHGATVEQAIAKSGLLEEFPEIDLGGRNKVGVWNKLVKLDTPLRDRDRVEIYRPLIADPKEVRRQRAAEGKVMKKGAGELTATGSETAA